MYEKEYDFNIVKKNKSYENIIIKIKKDFLYNYIHMNNNDKKTNSYDL